MKESNYKTRALEKKAKGTKEVYKPIDVTEQAEKVMKGIPSYLKRNKK